MEPKSLKGERPGGDERSKETWVRERPAGAATPPNSETPANAAHPADPPRRALSEPPPKPPSHRPAPPTGEPLDEDRLSAEAMPLVRPRSSPIASVGVEDASGDDLGVELTYDDEPPISISGAHQIEPGRIVDGRYEIETLLGSGAVGLVYRCRHLVLDKTLAIKVLRPDFARDAEVSERLVVEAKAASSVGSPHIVETVDFGRLADGSAFFVMEYLEGMPLTDLVEAPEPAPPEELLHVAIQLAEGLGEAHAAGIVHRDLKPDNVFLVTRGDDHRFVKILDFGVAKLAGAGRKLTRAGHVYGTPHYMAPEQAAGRATDPRTDVYAVGIILYEIVTGAVPFDAEEPMGILVQHVQDAPPDVRERARPGTRFIDGLERVVGKCLAKRAEDRYQSMAELRADLERLQAGLAPEAVVAPVPSLAPTPRHSARGAYVLAGLGVVVSAALGYALYEKSEVIEIVQTSAPAQPSAAASSSAAPAAAEAEATGRDVMVIVFPADAHVFRGRENLGKMPVTVSVPEGEAVALSVRHPGFVSRRLTLDGSKARVVVGLVRPKQGKKRASTAEAEAAADLAAERAASDLPPTATAPALGATPLGPTPSGSSSAAETGESAGGGPATARPTEDTSQAPDPSPTVEPPPSPRPESPDPTAAAPAPTPPAP